ncbi:hypothetical protein GOP47_0013394 [Adiantum capillus-veneris]|uniref:FHA domain-containing protein n=1 Tax=Adiantum capillus-veneris TaxID=13818 RepID=A0A9D4UNF3_ADICA|nr:hypothetical protein GOP47_0013394 [Adiantum capillus-veneris]
MASTGSSTRKFPEPDLPFLSVFKDGVLLESMCLHNLDSIVLGRHTNCDLMVTHPSVSRHHLEIQVLPGSREILLTDLDSIHGTWINGEQALPLVPVIAKEGDSFKLGASSRLYSVQWRPRPLQNSTSSEEHSDNSDSPLDCTKFKEQGPTGSTTTMESSKAFQALNAGTMSQPDCSTKCDDIHANQEQNTGQGSGFTDNSLNKVSGACIMNEENTTDVSQEGRTAAESLSKERIQEVVWILNDEKWAQVLHEGKTADVDTLIFNDRIALMARDSDVRSQESKYMALSETTRTGARHVQIHLQSYTDKDEIIMEADKRQQEESGNNQVELTVCEPPDSEAEKILEEGNASLSKLWVRRSSSNPPPNLVTSSKPACSTIPLQDQRKTCPLPSAPPMPLSYLVNNLVPSAPPLLPHGKLLDVDRGPTDNSECISNYELAREGAKEYSIHCHQEKSGNVAYPMKQVEGIDEYVSDKENDSPLVDLGCKHFTKFMNRTYDEGMNQERRHSAATEGSRRPFQLLALTADGGCKPLSPAGTSEENSITRITKRPSPVIHNLDLMLRRLKGTTRSESHRISWHIVVDASCFLDSNSFKSLRQLEGIREVRLIIPKIVISELDFRRGMGRSQRKALNWIESCMVKLPSWIHVQSSSENLPVATTPPVSPLSAPSTYGGSYESMVSPTNGDHVLSCALLFNSTVFSGQVALLTNDIALKIKAMAEGIICEAPSTFCESLLSPYSGRFLWATSIAHGHGWTEKPCHIKSCSALAPRVLSGDQSTKEAVISTVKAVAFRKHHAVESLKKQCYKQAQGLKVALPH